MLGRREWTSHLRPEHDLPFTAIAVQCYQYLSMLLIWLMIITVHDIIKCIDALVCLYLKSQPCRAINPWSTRCSSHHPTHPAAQPHIPRTTITSEDASRKLFNGDQLTTASLQTTNLSTIVSYFQNANSIEVYWNRVESVWYLVCNVLVSWTRYYILQYQQVRLQFAVLNSWTLQCRLSTMVEERNLKRCSHEHHYRSKRSDLAQYRFP